MPGITPIPSTRVSNQLVRSRLLSQLQFDQQSLFHIQQQISTGRRISLPSEDAPAALRAISLQRLIERKTQVQTNLVTNQSFLSATDATLNSVSGLLADIRGAAIGVVDVTSSDVQREAVATSVERAIQQLVDTGNQKFRGRYLFSGTRTTVAAFEIIADLVRYNGNEGELQSFSDIDVLFESSMHGNEVFGAISEPVLGSADLNPVLTFGTRLSDLRGGNGISDGSITIGDGTSSKTIDLSSAATIGDVARLIEANPPGARELTVTVTPTGLVVEIDTAGGGNLTITEVGGGTTADELGILEESGVLTSPLVGQDLDPRLQRTTPLDDILGARASARVVSSGLNNDFIITAQTAGPELNGVVVQFVDDDLLQAGPGLSAGNETAQYAATAVAARASLALSGVDNDIIITANTPGTDFNNVSIVLVDAGDVKTNPTANYTDVGGVRTLTLGIDDTGETTLGDLITEIEANTPFSVSADPSAGEGFDLGTFVQAADAGNVSGNTGNSGGAAGTLFVHTESGVSIVNDVVDAINSEGTFSAALDSRDVIVQSQAGFGAIELAATATTSGGSGIVFDKNSGIKIAQGEEVYDISFATAETIEDLLNIINGSGAGALAEINEDGTGINVRSRLSGADFSIAENGGTTATELGIRSFNGDTRLDDLNFGLGVQIVDGVDFEIDRNDGTPLEIDLTGAETVGDVIDLINNHVDNQDADAVVARLAVVGNGIELVDDNPNGADALTVRRSDLSLAAVHLGFVVDGADVSGAPVSAVAPSVVANLANPNTDLTFTANQAGTALNDTKIVFVDTGGVTGDSATATYNGTDTLTIDIDATQTTANAVISAVALDGTFTATRNTDEGANDGTGVIDDVGAEFFAIGGTAEIFTAADVNPVETKGVFNSLIRLRDALTSNNLVEIERTLAMLDEDLSRINFARAEIGTRQQALDVLQTRLGSEEIELRESLSLEIDVDLTEAISALTARQISLEASLRTTATVLQLSLLNFL